ncbi:hypothetical protein ACFFWC_29755 [Plantactinospora siamensis]|uniref:Uncharacterized protein n=1 Tax=Plantactinospora siamensis TaxID=555372 RepID=A0ABV6NPA0_9ACTN
MSLPAAVTAIDVHNGRVRSYCPLPGTSAELASAQDYTLGMRQGGVDYPPFRTDVDLLLRTQYFSPDFRWFGAPGLPLIDVAAGKAVSTDWTGVTVGLGRDLALLRTGQGASATWCTRSLPPKAGEACTALTAPAGAGGFVIGSGGTPVWVPAAAQPYAFGPVTGYAITDGTRLYGADYLSTADRRAQREKLSPTDPPIDIDPAGRGGFVTSAPTPPAGLNDIDSWFSVDSVGDGKIHTRYHRTKAHDCDSRCWMWGDADARSRAIVDNGTVAITAAFQLTTRDGQDRVSTRFGALMDDSGKVYDLSKERGLECPRPQSFCRIVAWPDGSLGPGGTAAP